MLHAVSISIGSSKRDKKATLCLLGQEIQLERIGTDGDLKKAAELFLELDGKVDAFGLGGADLNLVLNDRKYPLRSIRPIVRGVERTPLVDGVGLKNTLESTVAAFLLEHIELGEDNRKVLLTASADRWGMFKGFRDCGFEFVLGDLLFGLKVPIPLRREKDLVRIGRAIMPVVSRMPFSFLYPVGEARYEKSTGLEKWFDWADIIGGDSYYIVKYMPEDLKGKIIVTNTTTEEDVAAFQSAGVKALVTTTPTVDGRSFGTNLLEAALVAVSGKKRLLSDTELTEIIKETGISPELTIFEGN